MNLLFVIKPYEIEVYSEENANRTLLGVEPLSRIEQELPEEYEKRMIFVCKNLCQDAKKHVGAVHQVFVYLCYPWCTYDHVDIKKTFDEDTPITERLIESLKLQKLQEDVQLLESQVSHILLNGYTTTQPYRQKAKKIEMQVLNIYTKVSFAEPLKKTIESIFHTHKVTISSIYTYALKTSRTNGFAITIEDESIDISYVAEGKTLLNVFIPYSYTLLERNLITLLDADAKTVERILISKNSPNAIPKGKQIRNIWPDLKLDTQLQIQKILDEHISTILKYLHTLIDQVRQERTFTKEEIHISTLNKKLASVYGYMLGQIFAEDSYIRQRLFIEPKDVYIDYLF